MNGEECNEKFNSYSLCFFSISVAGCGEDQQLIALEKVIFVSEGSFTLKDKPAVTIAIGKDKDHAVSITIQREQIRTGYASILPARIPINPMDIDAVWANRSYILSTNHDCSEEFHIKKIDRNKRIATVSVLGQMVDPNNLDSYITIPETVIQITDSNFDKLIK